MKGNVSIKGSAIEKPKTRKVRKTQEDPYKMIFEGVVLEVRKNPRISLWSAKSAAVFRFLKKLNLHLVLAKRRQCLLKKPCNRSILKSGNCLKTKNFNFFKFSHEVTIIREKIFQYPVQHIN